MITQDECAELREMAAWFDSCGKRENGDFLRGIAERVSKAGAEPCHHDWYYGECVLCGEIAHAESTSSCQPIVDDCRTADNGSEAP